MTEGRVEEQPAPLRASVLRLAVVPLTSLNGLQRGSFRRKEMVQNEAKTWYVRLRGVTTCNARRAERAGMHSGPGGLVQTILRADEELKIKTNPILTNLGLNL